MSFNLTLHLFFLIDWISTPQSCHVVASVILTYIQLLDKWDILAVSSGYVQKLGEERSNGKCTPLHVPFRTKTPDELMLILTGARCSHIWTSFEKFSKVKSLLPFLHLEALSEWQLGLAPSLDSSNIMLI